MNAKFSLGKIVATPGALHALEEANQDALHFVARHASGIWGDLDADDCAANDRAIAHEGNPDLEQRVLSAYVTLTGTRIWIITEHDRSVTTLLLPDEY